MAKEYTIYTHVDSEITTIDDFLYFGSLVVGMTNQEVLDYTSPNGVKNAERIFKRYTPQEKVDAQLSGQILEKITKGE